MSNILEVKNLKKYFSSPKGTVHAVDDVSFGIEQGQTVGIVGESGCGKTTLGRVILHLADITSGKMIFKGEDITDAKGAKLSELRGKMQIIFQDPYSSLDPRMYVGKLIAESLKNRHLGNAETDRKVKEVMDTVGIAQRLYYSYPHELDGGLRQRVVIARALALDPEFIVCDEPVSALDVSIQAQVLNLLLDLQKEKNLTYMFITHDLSVVRYISDEICVMYLGQMVEKGPAEELFTAPLHPYTKALLAAVPQPVYTGKRKSKEVIHGEVTSPINPPPGCRFFMRCPFATDNCRQEQEFTEYQPGHFAACNKCMEINNI